MSLMTPIEILNSKFFPCNGKAANRIIAFPQSTCFPKSGKISCSIEEPPRIGMPINRPRVYTSTRAGAVGYASPKTDNGTPLTNVTL